MFDFFGDFFQSPAGRGDVSATSPLVAETNFTRDWGDVPATSPRPLRDLLETEETSPRPLRDLLETEETSPRPLRDLLETEETLRRLLRDTAWRCLTHFSDHVTERVLASSNDRSSCRSRYYRQGAVAATSPLWWERKLFLASRVARVAATDQSR